MTRVRECVWLWAHEPGSHNEDWGLPACSRISPVEAACYMGIENVIMVRYKSEPLPPDRQYLIPFKALRRVVWSAVGAGGTCPAGEIDRTLYVAGALPNMTGVMLDDFFRRGEKDVGVLSVPELQTLRERLSLAGRQLELWVVLYDHQLDLPADAHLRLCDKVSFWTWRAEQLAELERNFSRFAQLAPEGRRRVLGCYMWDYGAKQPMPLELMAKQCEFALRLLKERRIGGIIFLGSCLCDLELPAVEWTRAWLKKVSDERLPA